MSLEDNLREMERGREAYWLCHPTTSPSKLRWRALTARHCFHVLPGESLLELGAGSGLWTEHLAAALRGENPITAAVFNDDLAARAAAKNLPGVCFLRTRDLAADLPAAAFDYVVGTAILSHSLYEQNLQVLRGLLKPGGQLLFFEASYWNPQVFLKSSIPPLGRWSGNAVCQVALRKGRLRAAAERQQFTDVEVIPYDIVHARTPRRLLPVVQSLGLILEHAPLIRDLCGTLYLWARKPGGNQDRRPTSLAVHRQLFGSTSVVVPCRNEEANVARLVDSLLGFYSDYICEILIVNDNSTDRTAEVARRIASREPRVRLLDRTPPNGVGRALRDGYAAAAGRYILSLDCDFLQIVPELRDLFDVVAAGHDGAIGSRFSRESILVNYPFLKILANRGFHLLLNLLCPLRARDISNNLKLYRADILRGLAIRQDRFAANVETGLLPLLAGYDIREVPTSWINRTSEMGRSSFNLLKVTPDYSRTLWQAAWSARGRGLGREPQASGPAASGAPGATGAAPPEPSCPLCGLRDMEVYREGPEEPLASSALGPSRQSVFPGRILRCRGCRFAFRQVRPDESDLQDLYRGLEAHLYDQEVRGRAATAARHLRIVGRYVAGGRLLDVGCASAAFLRCAADAGWEAVGVEPSQALCDRARSTLNGRARVICATLQEAGLSGSAFDAVTLWDVLEHVTDPVAFLRLACSLLRPGGHLFVNVPDLDSAPARLLGSRWPLLLPEHLSYFNRQSLVLCGQRAALAWRQFGRRPASFSVRYILYRLSQHHVPAAAALERLVGSRPIGQTILSIPMGELYGVAQRLPCLSS